MIEWKAGRKLL